MRRLLIVSLLVFFVANIYAQKSEVGIGIGIATYDGDLSVKNVKSYISQSHPAIQVFYSYYFNRFLNTKVSLGATTLSASDSKSDIQWQKERNLSFKTNIYEFNAKGEYNIFGINHVVNPFIFAGVNAFSFNPKTKYNGEWVYLQPLGTEGQGSRLHPDKRKYKLYDISMVFGIGAKIRLNNSVTISVELGWRRTNTDYIDDVSGDYINYYELVRTNGKLAAELADRTNEYYGNNTVIERRKGEVRGGAKIKDYYAISFVNFVYTLNSGNPFRYSRSVSCPRF